MSDLCKVALDINFLLPIYADRTFRSNIYGANYVAVYRTRVEFRSGESQSELLAQLRAELTFRASTRFDSRAARSPVVSRAGQPLGESSLTRFRLAGRLI